MVASFSWVDFSTVDRDRMRRAIALFQERETRDELGLGTIRDAFAEAMFPGTSTIQTRLRYFLFVPWIYQRHERLRTSPAHIAARARADELALVEPLMASDDIAGTIGRVARDSLMRLPSSVYWAGLQRWDIFLPRISLEDYHRRIESIGAARRDQPLSEEGDGDVGSHVSWHPRLPPAPAKFPDGLSFRLTGDEARFLQGRITTSCDGTALAHFAMHGGNTDVSAAWDYPNQASLPADIRALIELARRFSLVVHGSALLYNLMLSEEKQRDDWVASYTADLEHWASQPEAKDLKSFPLVKLWDAMTKVGANPPASTRLFVEAWANALSTTDPSTIATNAEARRLVRDRERRIKGARSRFVNRRALDQWGGRSGASRLVYRWPIAQTLLNDLHAGLAS